VETGWRNITSQGRTHVVSAGLTEWSRNWSSAAWGFSEVLQQRRVLCLECHQYVLHILTFKSVPDQPQ